MFIEKLKQIFDQTWYQGKHFSPHRKNIVLEKSVHATISLFRENGWIHKNDEDEQILIKKRCQCYIPSNETSKESASPDCKICNGTGYITRKTTIGELLDFIKPMIPLIEAISTMDDKEMNNKEFLQTCKVIARHILITNDGKLYLKDENEKE